MNGHQHTDSVGNRHHDNDGFGNLDQVYYPSNQEISPNQHLSKNQHSLQKKFDICLWSY